MDFELDEDQRLLQESVQRFLAREYTFERRREILERNAGFDPAIWSALAEQGLLAVGLPEEHGGFGGPVETMVVMEQLGRSLVLEPWLGTVVLGAGLLREAGSPEQQSELFPHIAAGDCRIALAHHEAASRYALDRIETRAERSGDGWVLRGEKSMVPDAPVADLLIVSAREREGGLGLFLVETGADELERHAYRTHDGRTAAHLHLRGVRVPARRRLGEEHDALPALARVVDRAIAALCAEAVGIIEALNEATLEYLKSRRQFGQPIGRFQVLQHRMADMFLAATQARSMSLLATGRCTHSDERVRRRALSAAKAFIGQAARFVGQQAVQLHGGMGISAELAAGHWFKRLTMIEASFGDSDHHLGIVSEAILAERA